MIPKAGLMASLWGTGPDLSGDIKQFFIVGMGDDHILLPEHAHGQSFADGRLKLNWSWGDWLQFEAHHVATFSTSAAQSRIQLELAEMGQDLDGGGFGLMSGVGLTAPEAVDLGWHYNDGNTLSVLGRTDRLSFKATMGNVDLQLGRQPIVFGNSFIFNPLDLFIPFSAATIDAEYKAGVDAIRLDAYSGMSGQLTLFAVYMGDWTIKETAIGMHGKGTVGQTDISGFAGSIYGDPVIGSGVSTSFGSVGVNVDATLTWVDDPFVRASAGVFVKPGDDTTINAEVYIQSNGAESAESYINFAQSDPRFQRGELWLMGKHYVALGVSHQLHPLIQATVSGIANLGDKSGMTTGSVSISASDSVQINLGFYAGTGERPDNFELLELISDPDIVSLKSEFGLIPAMGFLQMRAYF